jgi:hypothetical protein
VTSPRTAGREDELPFGREADRGLFVEGTNIVRRGTDEWQGEAAAGGKTKGPVVTPESHRHPYVGRMFAECTRNAERLGAEGIDALNAEAAHADSAVSETINAQSDLQKARAAHDAAEKAAQRAEKTFHDLAASTGLSLGAGERLAQGFPLAIGFALEAVLLWLAFQSAEFGATWIRWLVVVLIGAFITFIAHSIAAWITADWDREPGRRKLHLGIGAGYAICVGGILVGLAYIRSQDITFASRSLSNPGVFKVVVLVVLFLVSVMGAIFAGYAGYRHGRTDALRHARRTMIEARKEAREAAVNVQKAEARERAASETEEARTGRIDALVDAYGSALNQVPPLSAEIGNHCLGAENSGFSIEHDYRREIGALRARVGELALALSKQHEEILARLEGRRSESRAQHA